MGSYVCVCENCAFYDIILFGELDYHMRNEMRVLVGWLHGLVYTPRIYPFEIGQLSKKFCAEVSKNLIRLMNFTVNEFLINIAAVK